MRFRAPSPKPFRLNSKDNGKNQRSIQKRAHGVPEKRRVRRDARLFRGRDARGARAWRSRQGILLGALGLRVDGRIRNPHPNPRRNPRRRALLLLREVAAERGQCLGFGRVFGGGRRGALALAGPRRVRLRGTLPKRPARVGRREFLRILPGRTRGCARAGIRRLVSPRRIQGMGVPRRETRVRARGREPQVACPLDCRPRGLRGHAHPVHERRREPVRRGQYRRD